MAGSPVGAVRSIAAELGDRGAHVAIVLAASIAALGLMGAIYSATGSPPAFDLSGEQHFDRGLVAGVNIPALFSGAVLFVTAGLAIGVGGSERRPWAILGAFLAFMGIDEVMKIHENLESSTGVDWQVLYLPLIAVGGVCWLIALRRMWTHHSERLLWLGGAAAWGIAQMLELVVNAGSGAWAPLGGEMAWVEEVLEMAGSSMFLLALYLVWRRLAAKRTRLSRHHAWA